MKGRSHGYCIDADDRKVPRRRKPREAKSRDCGNFRGLGGRLPVEKASAEAIDAIESRNAGNHSMIERILAEH